MLDMGCKSMELVFDCEQIRLMFKKKQTTIENYFDDGDYELLYHDWDEQETVADRNTVSLAVRHKKTGEEKKIWIRLVKVYSHGARTYVMNETDYPYAVFNDVVDIMAKSLVKIPYAEKNVKDIYNLYRITDDLSENPQSGALFLKVSETESTADRRAKAEYMLEVALGRIHFVWE